MNSISNLQPTASSRAFEAWRPHCARVLDESVARCSETDVAGCNEFITLHRYQYLLIPYGPSNGVLCPVTTLSQPLSHGPHPLVTSHTYFPHSHTCRPGLHQDNCYTQAFTSTTHNSTSPLCRAATHRRKAPLLRPTSLNP